jgi:hypothetical protein
MTGINSVLLSTSCFAPVQYFTKLILFDKIYLEQFENFTKQTYRNRYEIYGANGNVSLVVPVVKGRDKKIKIRDLLISYDTDWQRNHWRTLFSAYNSSPFFEYYQDDIQPFFEKPWKFLFDYNHVILETLCALLEIEPDIVLTDDFEQVPQNTLNLREAISPKKHKSAADPHFRPQTYTQVFTEKSGFIPNLSILDLLFNEGPNAISILENSTVKT